MGEQVDECMVYSDLDKDCKQRPKLFPVGCPREDFMKP